MSATQTFARLDPSEWAAFGTVATAVLTLALVLVAWRQLREVVVAQRDQARPYVDVRPTMRDILVCLRIENSGRSAAHEVHVRFDQPLGTTRESLDWLDTPLFNGEGMAQMSPGTTIDFFLDRMPDRHEKGLPLRISGVIESSVRRGGRLKRLPDERFTLDLRAIQGSLVGQRGLPEIAKELEKIQRQITDWRAGASGGLRVWAYNGEERDRRDLEEYREWQQERLRALATERWGPPTTAPADPPG